MFLNIAVYLCYTLLVNPLLSVLGMIPYRVLLDCTIAGIHLLVVDGAV